jgi:hypothetical protein
VRLIAQGLGQSPEWIERGLRDALLRDGILYITVENCRRLGINPKEYLTDVFTHLSAMLAKDAITLTAANWLMARSGKVVLKAA